jgi:hypothetical protein
MPPPNSKVNLNKKKPDWFLYSYKFLHFFNFLIILSTISIGGFYIINK